MGLMDSIQERERVIDIRIESENIAIYYRSVHVPEKGHTITFRDVADPLNRNVILRVTEVDWYIVKGTKDTRLSRAYITCEEVE
jgi:hypothetical protein